MSTKTDYPLAAAFAVARAWQQRLSPVCECVAVAGSIRRAVPVVHDIELVFVPRVREVVIGLFGETQVVDLAGEAIDEAARAGLLAKRENEVGIVTWGTWNKLAVDLASGIPIDFFTATARGWWRSLVIRTGPKELNVNLIVKAARNGIRVHAYGEPAMERMTTGDPVECKSEEEFFSLCGMAWIRPEERT